MAVRPLSPATRLRFGGPLPRQLPDRTQVSPPAHCCFHLSAYGVSAAVSRSCPPPKDKSLCITHPSAADALLHPHNLHVLSTPPAFILSQDQTLVKKILTFGSPYLLVSRSFALYSFQGAPCALSSRTLVRSLSALEHDTKPFICCQ